MKTVYHRTALIGGGADALDGIDGLLLSNNDVAFVMMSGISQEYILNSTSGATESSPYIIAPDSSAGDKRWLKQGGAFLITTHGATEAAVDLTMYGDAHKITGAYTITLPLAVVGMVATFRASTAATFSLDCNGADHFEMFDGTVLDAGDKITSGGTKNEFVTIYCESANTWIIIGQNGAFTDGGA